MIVTVCFAFIVLFGTVSINCSNIFNLNPSPKPRTPPRKVQVFILSRQRVTLFIFPFNLQMICDIAEIKSLMILSFPDVSGKYGLFYPSRSTFTEQKNIFLLYT